VEGVEQSYPLSEIVRALKKFSAKRINVLLKRTGKPIWQRNYYEHIVRDGGDWGRIRAYMIENPRRWGVENV
jgi:REP element-mobilizing transposase RayT